MKIKRQEPGEGSRDEEFILNVGETIKDYSYQITVEEQKLTKEEANELLLAAKDEIDHSFFGKNQAGEDETARYVTADVNPRTVYQNGLVEAEWFFSDYQIVDEEGKIEQEELPEEGIFIETQVLLSCGEIEQEYQFGFRVYPRPLDEKAQLLKLIDNEIKKSQEKQGEEYLELPEEISGQKLSWEQPREHYGYKLVVLFAAALVLGKIAQREKEKEKQKKREEQLKLDYPEMVSKLTILLGAGMSVKQAWNKISDQYRGDEKNKKERPRLVYEEMMKTSREMEDGMGERSAYQRFAERTGVQLYRRFVRLLLQNMSKGSAGIYELLELETQNAYLERKNYAKKRGEEAGTKMLLPMMLMLGIVMAIVLVPALISFQI